MADNSGAWKPDASFREIIDDEFKGVGRAKKALEAAGITLGDGVITSRDQKMAQVTEELRSASPPTGLIQWQLPIFSDDRATLYFISVAQPGAKVPPHKHGDDSIFRIVISGSLIFEGAEFVSGEWMYIPKGVSYSYEAGDSELVTLHTYH